MAFSNWPGYQRYSGYVAWSSGNKESSEFMGSWVLEKDATYDELWPVLRFRGRLC